MRTLPRLLLGLLLGATQQIFGQTIVAYHVFGHAAPNASYLYTNADGAYLYSRPILVSNILYGATSGDNSNGLGGLYRINADGSGFTNFFAFGFVTSNTVNGSGPEGLTAQGGTLYGATREGGTNFTGSIYSIHTDGTGFSQFYEFGAVKGSTNTTNVDGAYPAAPLTISGDTLYGTTYQGGSNGLGTVFRINTNGSGFTNLWTFNGTNGANPEAALTVVGNVLYGTTYQGGVGSSTNGTVFAVHNDGTGFMTLHYFSALGYPYAQNSDGANPESAVYYYNGFLYGLAPRGGSDGNGYGEFYSVSTNGEVFNPLYSFDFTHGAAPLSDLLFTNGTFYGTTTSGGTNEPGVVFEVQPNGSGFADLYDFALAHYSGSGETNEFGAEPWSGVVMAGTALVGVTPVGGAGGVGTIYALVTGSTTPPPPTLSIGSSGTSIALTWTAGAYVLQSTPDLGTPFSNVAGASGSYTVAPTNARQFFRLAPQ